MPAIAFTADIWKSGARKYYISLSVHVFDDEFEVIPFVLSLRQLTGRHLAINVEAFIKYELNEKFQMMPNQRAGITTDCGSEMFAATAHGLFGPRHSCIAHVWNNVVKNDQVQSATSTIMVVKKRRIQPIYDEFLSEDNEPVIIQPETRSITLVGLLERVFNLLDRCRQLITDIRNIGVVQTYALVEIGKKGRGFTIDMDVRWNTTYQMIDRLLEHQNLVDVIVRRKFDGLTVCQTNRLKLVALNPDDWDVLRALHQVLTGFDVATTIVSASHYPTFSDSFWAITKLRQILISNTDQPRYVEFLKTTALNYLDMYIEKHLSKGQQEGMLIAAFLDPETHNDMSQDDFSKAMEIVKQKLEQMSTTTSSSTTTTTTRSSFLPLSLPTSQMTFSKKDAAKQRMNQLAGIGMNLSNDRSITAAVEISLFTNAIKTNQSFKEFWSTHNQSFPRLVTLVRRYSIVPATSVASESAFSVCWFIARKQRSSLSSRTLRQLLVLKYRKNLLKFKRQDQPSLLQDRLTQSLSFGITGSTAV
ncbi:unnamed protein product [Adineta steineri]|uniref:HAT C-terminal dimerisation domain-containing protein n=2 Tax=Adineta steineri TaxID=433720 RepID=A0A819U382_9BILA|nr:unnamed protein product [Adineta steineri]